MAVSTILFIILSGVIAVLAAILFYFYKPERSQKLRLILSVLRFITLFSVLLLLINPVFKQVTYTTVKSKLALLIDDSNSIAFLGASDQVKTTVESLLNNKEINERFDIDPYSFGTNIKSLDSLTFSEEQTNIANALSSLQNIYKDASYVPLLITDGNSNLGANYRYTSVDSGAKPIYFLGVGDTVSYEDLSIDRINVNKYAYLNNEFPVELIASYTGKNNVKAVVSVLKNGNIIYKEEKSFSSTQNTQRFNFFLKANSIGVQKYTIDIKGLSEEKNKDNNTKSFAVEVIDQRSNVLIVYNTLHPDLGTLKKSIESNQLRSAELKEAKKVTNQELNDSDLVILFEPDANFATLYSELEKLNKNRFTISGTSSNRSFLNSVQSTFTLPLNNQSEEAQPIKNTSFSAFQLGDLNFQGYPPLQTAFGSVNVSGTNDVILYQRIGGVETTNPLLGLTEIDGRREVYLFGTGIYQWRIQTFLNTSSFEEFDNLIDKLIQYTASNQKRKRLDVNFDRFYYGGSSVKINAQYFDQNYVFDPGAQLQIEIQNTAASYSYTSPVVFRGNGYEVTLPNLEPGDYTFTIEETATKIRSEGAFTVIPYNAERQNLNSDYTKMKQVASETLGQIYLLNQSDALIVQLLNDDRFTPVQRAVEKSVPLVNFIWLLILIVACLTTEWFVRKYNGLI